MARAPTWFFAGALELGERHGGRLLTFKRRRKILRGPFKGKTGLESRSFTMSDITGFRRGK